MKAFARNRCSTHSALRAPMSLLSYNMKFRVSCSHRSASKTAFAFMDFLRAPRICVSCSCFGGNGLSIHSHYPFHLHRNLDLRPLEPVTKAGFTMGHAGSSGMARARGHLNSTENKSKFNTTETAASTLTGARSPSKKSRQVVLCWWRVKASR